MIAEELELCNQHPNPQATLLSGNQDKQQPNPLICSETQPAHNVCLNSNCQQSVFLCESKLCLCFKKHKGCIKSSIQSISEALEEKIISIEPFENKINDLINQAIDNLSLFGQEIIEKARQSLNFIGLTQNQRKFIKIVKNGAKLKITAKQMHQIYQSIDNNQQFTNDMLIVQQKINITWNSFEAQMKKSFLNIKKQLNLLTEGGVSHIFGGSKIIKKYEERINLARFFDKKIKETSLLYRASENDFQVDMFYENCKNIQNTIVICRTQYKKIIGGFTQRAWTKLEGQQKFYEDHSRISFVFSLTNNDKFRLQPNCYATKYSMGAGPTFGNTAGLDLSICNRANIIRDSISRVNTAYYNDKYQKDSEKSWENFSGSKDLNYLLQEWEVWNIQFEN